MSVLSQLALIVHLSSLVLLLSDLLQESGQIVSTEFFILERNSKLSLLSLHLFDVAFLFFSLVIEKQLTWRLFHFSFVGSGGGTLSLGDE